MVEMIPQLKSVFEAAGWLGNTSWSPDMNRWWRLFTSSKADDVERAREAAFKFAQLHVGQAAAWEVMSARLGSCWKERRLANRQLDFP
jgi:hypothetical protein